ncbi:MAG: Pepco domain-containing protein [Spirulinaceae cyanobacterium]
MSEPQAPDPRTIRIITAIEQPASKPIAGERGALRDTGKNLIKAAQGTTEVVTETLKRGVEIPVETLKSQMAKMYEIMTEVFEQFEVKEQEKQAGLRLEEVELSIEIDSRGELSIVGFGGTEVGGKGAITLKFKRPK